MINSLQKGMPSVSSILLALCTVVHSLPLDRQETIHAYRDAFCCPQHPQHDACAIVHVSNGPTSGFTCADVRNLWSCGELAWDDCELCYGILPPSCSPPPPPPSPPMFPPMEASESMKTLQTMGTLLAERRSTNGTETRRRALQQQDCDTVNYVVSTAETDVEALITTTIPYRWNAEDYEYKEDVHQYTLGCYGEDDFQIYPEYDVVLLLGDILKLPMPIVSIAADENAVGDGAVDRAFVGNYWVLRANTDPDDLLRNFGTWDFWTRTRISVTQSTQNFLIDGNILDLTRDCLDHRECDEDNKLYSKSLLAYDLFSWQEHASLEDQVEEGTRLVETHMPGPVDTSQPMSMILAVVPTLFGLAKLPGGYLISHVQVLAFAEWQ